MQEFLKDIFLAVITAAVPVLTAYLVVFIRKAGESAAAKTDSTRAKTYIEEITEAIAAAVNATNQTYVDALKKAGKFDRDAQKEAAQKSLATCLASISPAATRFIESAYGDAKKYLTAKIEAEVRKQKFYMQPLLIGEAVETVTTETEVTVEEDDNGDGEEDG